LQSTAFVGCARGTTSKSAHWILRTGLLDRDGLSSRASIAEEGVIMEGRPGVDMLNRGDWMVGYEMQLVPLP
jgi:hypothetical protein